MTRLAGLLSWMLTSAHAASITTETRTFTQASSQAQSVINLYCQASQNQFYQSKLILIDTRSEKYDFALTTAHGIQKIGPYDHKSCYIRDNRGEKLSVLDVYSANGYEPGTSTDWAVVKLDKLENTTIIRHTVTVIGNSSPINNEAIPITFPKARGINFNIQDCQALSSETIGLKAETILAHNCRVIKGQSGSPVIAQSENRDLLIGVHLGKAFVYRSPITKKPEHMGYFRLIDEDMIFEIDAAIRSLGQ